MKIALTAALCYLAWTRLAVADSTVAADGSGDFRTVQDAVAASPSGADAAHPWMIHVKPGTYREVVSIQREKRFITLRGEDPLTTTITFDLSAENRGPDGRPIGTFRTPTVLVDADDFSIENLTMVNSAGPVGQALALRVDGDRCCLRRCRLVGWQDTLLINRGRQYFEDCTIAGCTDFIFGGATSYFERCDIHILGNGYITAASTPDVQKYGLIFSHCRIVADRPGVNVPRAPVARLCTDYLAEHGDERRGTSARLASLERDEWIGTLCGVSEHRSRGGCEQACRLVQATHSSSVRGLCDGNSSRRQRWMEARCARCERPADPDARDAPVFSRRGAPGA